jgi:pyridine nucleotide-disulfide oxidoreductase family protein
VKRLLLLGGGHAHVHVLQALAQQPLPGIATTLVTPHARQMYSGMVPGLVAGHYHAGACAIALAPLAAAAGVSFVEGTGAALDTAARQVTLTDGRVAGYDALSIDIGSVMDRDAIAGAREHGLFVRPIEHFVALLDPLWELASRRAIDLVVIGGGAAGFELALAFHHRLCVRDEQRARIVLVTGGGPPLAGYPAAVVARGERVLRECRITVLPEACTAIAADHVRLANGARVACDAPVLALPSRAAPWLAGSGLALNERGYVSTGATLQSVSHPEVFAAGDIATRIDAPHPKSGVYAVRAGPPLAAHLRAYLAGAPLVPHAVQRRTLNLLSCGGRRAIASWGDWNTEGRWVWWWKDRIDRAFIARFSQPSAAISR